jgi:hypothetical protein
MGLIIAGTHDVLQLSERDLVRAAMPGGLANLRTT